MKYIKVIALQFLASFINVFIIFLQGNVSLSKICGYSFVLFVASVIMLIPLIISEIRAEKSENKHEINGEGKKSKNQKWIIINFKNMKYITSFITIMFMTAFITKCGTEAASLIINQIKTLIINNGQIMDNSMNILIIFIAFLPFIIPIILYYWWACTSLYESYKYYKKMTEK